MRRGARLVLLLAIVAAIVLTLTSCAPEDAQTSPGYVSADGTVTVLEGTEQARVVDLAGTSYDGEMVDVADYRGQVVVLNTWYASCPPCRAEAPDLVALNERDGVQLIGINSRDDAGTAQAFERTFGVQYPSIDDTGGGAIAALQGLVAVNAVPTSIILDPEGRVYARVLGSIDGSTLGSLADDAAASVGGP